MAVKFSPKSREAFTNAARTFNSMRTRAIKMGVAIEELPPKINTHDIFSELGTTEQLRQVTKTLKDYKHVGDFAQSTEVDFPATIGEIRTAKRSFKSERAKLSYENLKINKMLSKSETPIQEKQKLIERQATIEATLNIVSNRQKEIRAFRSKEEFKRAVGASQIALLKFDYSGWDRYRKNYIRRAMDLGEETGTNVSAIINKLSHLPLKQFKKWVEIGDNELSQKYDMGNNIATLERLAESLGADYTEFEDV